MRIPVSSHFSSEQSKPGRGSRSTEVGFRFRAWAGELGRPEKDLTARARFFLRHWSLPSLDLALRSRTSLMRVFGLGARSTSTRVSTMKP